MCKQRVSAWILLIIFYIDFVGSQCAYANFYSRYTISLYAYKSESTNKHKFNTNNNLSGVKLNIPKLLKTYNNTNHISKVAGGGPSQPEMASFKSINADNMVNLFTGDFSYNIPLLDVGGYPVNLFYSGGITMEQEASWVGLGWNINPGTITRNMRGIPDEFDGSDKIIKEQSVKEDKTVGITATEGAELIGLPLSVSQSQGAFYNTKTGFGLEVGGSLGITLNLADKAKDEKTGFSPTLSAGLGYNLNSQRGLTLQPTMGIYMSDLGKQEKYGFSVGTSYNARTGIQALQIDAEVGKYNKLVDNYFTGAGISYPLGTNISFANPSYTPSIRMPLTTKNFSFEAKIGGSIYGLHPHGSLKGYVSSTRIDEKDKTQTIPAVGYLNLEKGIDDKSALLDFNRINDNVYTPNSPVISVPYYTYDIFTINGEGTGGSFRAYRGNTGFVRDPYTRTKTEDDAFGAEVGLGSIFHAGIEYNYVKSPTTVYKWSGNNEAEANLKFAASTGPFEGAYFKNPAEKAIHPSNYYKNLENDNLVRLSLSQSDNPTVLSKFDKFSDPTISNPSYTHTVANTDNVLSTNANLSTSYPERDKRTQVISYLNAEQAKKVGLEKKIKSYPQFTEDYSSIESNCSTDKEFERWTTAKDDYRKANHISEINVLEPDGKRYVYGIPVYNTTQKEVSFSVATTDIKDDNSIVKYASNDNSTNNSNGADHFYQSETTPAYPHSFLLTALLSPDYVDVTNNGITDDDLGDAISFKYSMINLNNWRSPFSLEGNVANYNAGIQTDKTDDKASYTFGTRELWYMHSIESKNMIAVFRSKDRDDNNQPSDENGNHSSGSSKLLKRIDLYAKAAYKSALANGTTKPKPIKSVIFDYDYSHCKNSPSNSTSGKGKLTLLSVKFTFNGNDKNAKNVYSFNYGYNPEYKKCSVDRWGTYKPKSDNPSSLTNIDFPYTKQVSSYDVYDPSTNTEKLNADKYASAWNLSTIKLPAGGEINVSYEADDYAYVQNRRAAQMCSIVGFGNSNILSTSNSLVNSISPLDIDIKDGNHDNKYVFIKVPEAVSTDKEVFSKYLEGLNQLVFKLWIKLPYNSTLNPTADEYEPINVYAPILKYGVTSNDKIIWVKVANDGPSPMMATAINFLKNYQPVKAYPDSQNPDGTSVEEFVRSLKGLVDGYLGAFSNFERKARAKGMCTNVDLDRAFVRLDNPHYCKLGGGHRVKEIRIKDNWDKMIKNNSTDTKVAAEYGQHYDYTTTITVDGSPKTISSGVATYEPQIGAEENPFKEALQYSNKLPLGPTERGFIDMPIGETFFPSPMVGYSHVKVTSIHKNTTNKIVKSAVGSQETEFYTSKDFPSFSDYTPFDGESNVHYKPDPILKFFKIDAKEMVTLSQGFRVVLNDMNGKMRSQASYSETDNKNPIKYTKYEYKINKKGENEFTLDNTLKVADKSGNITTETVGKEIELMVDFREHMSETTSGGAQANLDGFAIGPFFIIIPIMFQPPMHSSSTFRSASVLKVINQYGILEKVTQIDYGSTVSTQNLVYDKETGDPLITVTQNEFENPVYSFTNPAYWAYSGMGNAYKNVDVQYTGIKFVNGFIVSPFVDQKLFESGDEVYAENETNTPFTNDQTCRLIGRGDIAPSPADNYNKIWALKLSKDASYSDDSRCIFINYKGEPFNSSSANIRIVRSGKRNQLNASVGTVTSLVNPIIDYTVSVFDPISNTTKDVVKQKIYIDASTKVVKASVQEFDEKWKSEDGFYTHEIKQDVEKLVPAHHNTNKDIADLHMWEYSRHRSWDIGSLGYVYKSNPNIHLSKANNYPGFEVRKQNPSGDDDYNSNTSISFDLSDVVGEVYQAKLSLYEHETHLNHSLKHAEQHGLYHAFSLSADSKIYLKRISDANWKDITNNGLNLGDLYYDYKLPPKEDLVIQQLYPNFGPKSFCDKCEIIRNHPLVTADNRIDLTEMVSKMRKSDKVNAIGIGFIAYGNISPEQRVCFSSGLQSGDPEGPQLDVTYYNSSEIYTGAPPLDAYCPTCTPLKDDQTHAYFAGVKLPLNKPLINGKEVIPLVVNEGVKYCYSFFDTDKTKSINPYLHGLLGNWKPKKSYEFMGERKNDGEVTNIKTDGYIKDFTPYWGFNNAGDEKPYLDGYPWVWKSQTSQINRKGLELENFDALHRHNAAIYGYNENLPIAIANNARYCEVGFDGFEDYGYTDQCNVACKSELDKSMRHLKLDLSASDISTDESHTGTSSLLVKHDKPLVFQGVVKNKPEPELVNSNEEEQAIPDLNINLNRSPYSGVIVNPKGIGLTGSYSQSISEYQNATVGSSKTGSQLQQLPYFSYNVGKNAKNSVLPSSLNSLSYNNLSIIWEGYFQVQETGTYDLGVKGIDDNARIELYNADLSATGIAPLVFSGSSNVQFKPVNLTAGHYRIFIKYYNYVGPGNFNIVWRKNLSQDWTSIPVENFYPLNKFDASSETNITNYCEELGNIQTPNNGKIDEFAMIQGSKMIVSTWVKLGGANTSVKTYQDKCSFKLSFADENGTVLLSSQVFNGGNIIEGWQRFESDPIDVPLRAKKFTLTLSNSSTTETDKVYFDDLRIHPYNANMKSFVYHPETLRLMAEMDENNFATFYEYDNDGTLTRVKKETVEGVKTIKETRSALQSAIK